MEDYAPLIAVALAPLAYPILRYILAVMNSALYRIFPDGPVKKCLFKRY